MPITFRCPQLVSVTVRVASFLACKAYSSDAQVVRVTCFRKF